ncbi:hypothetical protein MycrhN_3704 [Mycolicibacterium rhodesiae NBB3]|jgi:hypothetical protein|uniref:DUF4190 domain-containing protein n=1 Tax=Mycolicibacterium rhodesiae (strain NBB3) TaxID=710685 RepID=G8RVH5_MYCRN|nr:DUF4190 domain-containing protein [Mycolicibacterium rhodesiae]AEV74222.1 hypothetical protein MycrhN_3704 [Mycolicibacterium rhodesiae NBB3]
MTYDPERPAQQWQAPGGVEYPPLENTQQPLDYPTGAGLPPPIYPPPPPGYTGAPTYFPVYDPYRPARPPGTNGKAIASLILSITGWLCCAPLGIVGLILGVIAMRETKRTGQEGWGLALAGTIVGGLFTVALVVVVLIYIALGFSSINSF